MNPPEFFGSVIGKDPQLYLEEVKKITQIMHVSEEDNVELVSYRMKDIAHNWVVLWKKSRGEDATSMTW